MRAFSRVLFSAAVAANVAFSRPVQFSEALQSREIRSILPADLTSAQLEEINAAILERATFSARVTSAEYLDEIDRVLGQFINGEIDLATARLALKEKLDAIGYRAAPDEVGSITDFSSDRRIELVLNTNADMAQGYGTWLQGQDAAILDQWPARELYRAAAAKEPRDWPSRWQAAGGEFFDGRMIALKNTSIWTDISRFGTPYEPFDYGSHMATRDIDRDTAMSLGLIDRDTQIVQQDRGFNDDLKFSPQIRSAALKQALTEEGYAFKDGILSLKSERGIRNAE
jgi:hypothetical protein